MQQWDVQVELYWFTQFGYAGLLSSYLAWLAPPLSSSEVADSRELIVLAFTVLCGGDGECNQV